MKLLASGPIHKEPGTLPYRWVIRLAKGTIAPYCVCRQVWNGPGSTSYGDGSYCANYCHALRLWHEKVQMGIDYMFCQSSTQDEPFDPTDKANWQEGADRASR